MTSPLPFFSFFTNKKTRKPFIILTFVVTGLVVMFILVLLFTAPISANFDLYSWKSVEYSWSNLFGSDAFRETIIGQFIINNPLLIIVLTYVSTLVIIGGLLYWQARKK